MTNPFVPDDLLKKRNSVWTNAELFRSAGTVLFGDLWKAPFCRSVGLATRYLSFLLNHERQVDPERIYKAKTACLRILNERIRFIGVVQDTIPKDYKLLTPNDVRLVWNAAYGARGQSDLARYLGITQRHMAYINNGIRGVSLDKFKLLLQLLDHKIQALDRVRLLVANSLADDENRSLETPK